MKSATTFEERLARLNTQGASPEVQAQAAKPSRIKNEKKGRRLYFDALLIGGLIGAAAGTMFNSAIGLMFLSTLDWPTLVGLVQMDPQTGAHIASFVLTPVLFVAALVFSPKYPRVFQAVAAYGIGMIATNFQDLHMYVETIVIPGFWNYVTSYTSAMKALQ